MREIEPMERDGPTKKNLPQRAPSNLEQRPLDKGQALIKEVNNPLTFLVNLNPHNNKSKQARLLKCPTVRLSYSSNSEQNLLLVEQEDF